MPIIIAILLGLSALLVVIYPLLGLDHAAASAAGTDALSDMTERERSAKMALRDVDFDYRLGNLDESDHDALRDRYERRALAALRTRYEREQALERLIDEQLAALQDRKGGSKPAAGNTGNRASSIPSVETPTHTNDTHGSSSGQSATEKRIRDNESAAKNGHQRAVGPTRARRGRRV